MANTRSLRLQYNLFYELNPCFGTVMIAHVLPKSGLHWCDGDICWCHPKPVVSDDAFDLPEGVKIFLHQTYIPRGENGHAVR